MKINVGELDYFQNVDDRVKRHLEVVTEAEQKLVQLQSEKEKVVL